jgi:hypothetical protein
MMTNEDTAVGVGAIALLFDALDENDDLPAVIRMLRTASSIILRRAEDSTP